MLEQGIIMLIQAGLGSPPIANGGFLAELPKDATLPAYTYRVISNRPQTTLQSHTGFAHARIQIDCFGPTGASVILLANAINTVLQGHRGTLPDPDSTFLDSCFRSDMMDFAFDPDARNYRRMVEYELFYVNTN